MEYNLYFWILLAAVVGLYLLDLIADLLNLGNMRAELPKGELADLYDAERYAKSQAYTRERTRFGITSSTFDLAVFLTFWLCGGFGALDGLVRTWVQHPILQGLAFAGILTAGLGILGLPWSLYSTFVLEEKYGFNRTTPATFVLDLIKGALLGGILGGGAFAAIIAFFMYSGTWGWLYAWAVMAGLGAIFAFLAPRFIMPLFFKFTPLQEGDLSRRLHELCERLRFPVREMYVVDGSRRSSKANAFFTGFGSNRRIALFDTLIEDHPVDELEGILAHEIGHDKCKHMWKMAAVSLTQSFLMFWIVSLFVTSAPLQAALGVTNPSVYAGLFAFALMYEPVGRLLSIAVAYLSRVHEYEADAFAARGIGSPRPLMEALKRLSRKHLANLTPHPLAVLLRASHPPLAQRLTALSRVKV
ncbi:MAG TPA: M48 family metallopeptidase [Candidatus Methylacidiphilales bacterium]|nr:M48 family metallopeptidase [Candidatus Methylacidiphilales bacterium]